MNETASDVQSVEHLLKIVVDHRLPEPPESFYADQISVVQVPSGVRVVAWRQDPFTGAPLEAADLVMVNEDFERFRVTIDGLAETLRAGSPDVRASTAPPGLPIASRCHSVSLAYIACTKRGITLDFYWVPPIDEFRAVLGASPLPTLKPIIRIDMLPGRLDHLLR